MGGLVEFGLVEFGWLDSRTHRNVLGRSCVPTIFFCTKGQGGKLQHAQRVDSIWL